MGFDDFKDPDIPNWLPQTRVPFNLFQSFQNIQHVNEYEHYGNQLDLVS